jgi:hypothetical protein
MALRGRLSDGVIQRTVGKWLNAGVMESGNVAYHEVPDNWFVKEVRPRMKIRAFMVS